MRTSTGLLFAFALILLFLPFTEARADSVIISNGTLTFRQTIAGNGRATVAFGGSNLNTARRNRAHGGRGDRNAARSTSNFNIAPFSFDFGLRTQGSLTVGSTITFSGNGNTGFSVLTSGTINGVQ